MMEKSLFCLLFILCIGLLFKQAQDMGSIMTDIKTLVMLQSQQQREISDMKNLINLQTQQITQQHHDLIDNKTQITQQQHDLMDIKTQLIQQHGDLNEMKSVINLQIQQHSDKSEKESDVRGGCDGNIAGLTNLYIKDSPFTVPCDGAGWVVVLRRVDNKYNFDATWSDYKHGFGNPTGSFWLGLDTMHHYTSHDLAKLRIEFVNSIGIIIWAEYSYVRILGESNGYRLMVSSYTGSPTAQDTLSHHSGMKFTTKDQDNDLSPTTNIAETAKAGWWFHTSYDECLTRENIIIEGIWFSNGVYKKVEMKLLIK